LEDGAQQDPPNLQRMLVGLHRRSLMANRPPFQTELAINTHLMVVDIHHNALTGQEGTERQRHSASATFHP